MMEQRWPDDGLLAERCATGDASAFRVLVRRHHARLHAHAWRILMDSSAAEDVAQEVFLKLWSGSARFDAARGALVPWLLRITTNACLDARRRLKSIAPLEDAEIIADSAPGPEALAEQQLLMSRMATMPPRQRSALALFYLEGFTMAEIAEALETNAKAVEGLLSRGREGLRALVAEDQPFAGRITDQPHD